MRCLIFAALLLQVSLPAEVNAAPHRVSKLTKFTEFTESIKAFGRKLPKMATTAAAAAIISCAGGAMISCEEGRRIVIGITETENVDPDDEYAGQYVTLYIGNDIYEAYWELTPEGLLLLELDDGLGKVVLLEYAKGELVDNHPDIGADVSLLGIENGEDVTYYGVVDKVFDNGFYIIAVDTIEYPDTDDVITLLTPIEMLAHASTLPEDGGIVFLDDW